MFDAEVRDAYVTARINTPARWRIGENQGDWGVRALDLLIAGAALIVFAPLFLLIGAMIRLQDGGPAIFSHGRLGRNGATFPCLKFRTMVMDAEGRLANLLATDAQAREEWARDHKLRNDPRITRLGSFLRQTSLDELPQLLNILRGEMSLVGPRPIVAAEVVKYGRYFTNYCSVRPGLTGLWQVSGRSDVDYRRRVALDVLYTQHRNWRMDLHILTATIPAVLLRKGSR